MNPKFLSEPHRIHKTKEEEDYIVGLWNEMTGIIDEEEETNMARLIGEPQEPTTHIKYVSGLATTKVDPSEFMKQLELLSTIAEEAENHKSGVFMRDNIFQTLFRNPEVKFDLLPSKLVESGVVRPFMGLDLYAMPEEEVFLGDRDWFFVTLKEYDEYMGKIAILRQMYTEPNQSFLNSIVEYAKKKDSDKK